jgi:glycosyltransferase involved in cell wall biosynthesis
MKIYFLTTQSSKNYKSWSNIPYLTHINLEAHGHEVVNIVMRELWPVKFLFNFPVRVLRKFFKKNTIYFYVRTPLHFYLSYLISLYIKLVSKKSDVILVQGFSYPFSNGKNRMVLLGDWPSEYLFEHFLRRKPDFLEKGSLERENAVIESADAVVTLFPDVQEYMFKKFKNKNIFHFGNVVNIDENFITSEDFIEEKNKSNNLLFIGRPYYISGALELIEAINELNLGGRNFHVDIVGIDKTLIKYDYEWLSVYGYLDKGNPIQKDIYYKLLKQAKAFVNTTPGWSAFQATLEAMYFCNPIIVRENSSLKRSFPTLKDFSYIVDSPQDLKTQILKCFDDSNANRMKSKAARVAAEPNTWKNFVINLSKVLKDE